MSIPNCQNATDRKAMPLSLSRDTSALDQYAPERLRTAASMSAPRQDGSLLDVAPAGTPRAQKLPSLSRLESREARRQRRRRERLRRWSARAAAMRAVLISRCARVWAALKRPRISATS